jgi:hypothetical protein
MADESLRMPSSTFHAVLYLGEGAARTVSLPESVGIPTIAADWAEDDDGLVISLDFPSGKLHATFAEGEVDAAKLTAYHFHHADGETNQFSPWPDETTEQVVRWIGLLAVDLLDCMPSLEEDLDEAADWYESGLRVFALNDQPEILELITVEVPGELLTLPWLGSGHWDIPHMEGENHPVELVWNPEHSTPNTRIARVWTDPETDEPRSEAEHGVDWEAVGLPEGEVLQWLEVMYLNHHASPHIRGLLWEAAIARIAGLDRS